MTPPPKLLLIGPTPPPFHGVSVATETILRSAITDRFRLLHLETADRRGIDYVDKPDLHDVVLFVKQFCRNLLLILREKPDIFYIPISQSRIGFIRDSLFIIPAFIIRCPVILHLHGANFDALYRGLGRLEKILFGIILRRVAKFIVLGETLKPIFRQWATSDQVTVVPNGVPRATRSDSIVDRIHRRNDSLFRVLALSTLSRQKGLFVLLEAIPFVVREHRNVEFCIAGPWWGGTTESEAMALISESGISNYVRFVGQATGEKKIEFLRSGDVFVFPGVQQEGQPLTVLEAMSEGLPVIATDRGCLRETIVEGSTGFVVPPSSPEAIAEKVLHLMRDQELCRTMGHNARVRFESEYTMDLFAARMEGVFCETLSLHKLQTTGHPSRSEAS